MPLRPDLDGAGTMNGKRLAIRGDRSAAELRQLARREPDRAAACRMQAIAGALEGLARAEAARLAGMERQALRDAVVRPNAESLAGLHDRTRPGSKPRLFLPAGTPEPIVAAMGRAVAEALRHPDVARTIRELGFEPIGSTPEAFAAMLRQDAPVWRRVVDETGIRVR